MTRSSQPVRKARHRGVGIAALVATASTACAPAPEPPDETPPALLQFDRSVRLEQEAATSANVSIGDLDRDGHLDIVLVKGRHWPLTDKVLIGDGTGAFVAARPISEVADRSYSGELIDIDTDGDLDVVISNDAPDDNVVYLNDGAAGFTAGSSFGQGEWSTRHVSVADLNGDGQPDIIVANRTGNRGGFSYVCFNGGAGRFDADCNPVASESATTITPADFNGDGHLDLAVPNRDSGQSQVYLNDGTGAFNERVPFGPPDATIRKALVADLNGDGILDLVAIDERQGTALYLGLDGGGFGAAQPVGEPGPRPYALALADLNRDTRVDMIVGYIQARPVAYFNSGGGTFSGVPFGDAEGAAYGFATGDIDEDGVIDIAMARSDAPNMLYFGGAVESER